MKYEEFDLNDNKHVYMLESYTKPWKLKETDPEECFKQLYNLLKDWKSKGVDYKKQLQQLEYDTGNGMTSFFNMVGEDAFLPYIIKNYGQDESTWKIVNEILTITEKEGKEFCSLSRGWDEHKGEADAQGVQILKPFLQNSNQAYTHPIKKAIVEKLLKRELYDVPKRYTDSKGNIKNPNAAESFQKAFDFFKEHERKDSLTALVNNIQNTEVRKWLTDTIDNNNIEAEKKRDPTFVSKQQELLNSFRPVENPTASFKPTPAPRSNKQQAQPRLNEMD